MREVISLFDLCLEGLFRSLLASGYLCLSCLVPSPSSQYINIIYTVSPAFPILGEAERAADETPERSSSRWACPLHSPLSSMGTYAQLRSSPSSSPFSPLSHNLPASPHPTLYPSSPCLTDFQLRSFTFLPPLSSLPSELRCSCLSYHWVCSSELLVPTRQGHAEPPSAPRAVFGRSLQAATSVNLHLTTPTSPVPLPRSPVFSYLCHQLLLPLNLPLNLAVHRPVRAPYPALWEG